MGQRKWLGMACKAESKCINVSGVAAAVSWKKNRDKSRDKGLYIDEKQTMR